MVIEANISHSCEEKPNWIEIYFEPETKQWIASEIESNFLLPHIYFCPYCNENLMKISARQF